MRNSFLKDILLVIIIFVLGFGSKALILNNLGNTDLVGPDPYLFYRYTYELYTKGYIDSFDCLRYYPLCSGLDKANFISYAGYLTVLLYTTPYFKPFFDLMLKLFNVLPAATNPFDIGIHLTVPLFFGLASIIFYFLLKEIFKNRIISFLLTLLFIVTPLLTFRIAIFDKELIATPFILLAFLSYIKAIRSKSIEKKQLYIIIILFIYSLSIIYLYLTNPSDLIFIIPTLFAIFTILITSFSLKSFGKETYYSLSALFTILAAKGWGGWTIIPIVIGTYEVVRFFLNKEDLKFVYSLLYIPITMLMFDETLSISSLFSTRYILPIFAFILIITYWLFDKKLKIFEKIKKENILQKKVITVFALSLIALPVIYNKVGYILSNPWTERFGSSVAEQQPSNPDQYLGMLTKLGFLLSFLSFYIILLRNTDKINLSSLDKNAIINLLLPLVLSMLFFYIVVLSGFHIMFSWFIFFILITYIILYLKKFDDIDLLIIVWSALSFVIGSYINRLIFYTGYVFPILVGYFVNSLDNFRKYIDSLKNILKELIILIPLILSSISGIYLAYQTKLWIFLLPVFSLMAFVIYYYILEKQIDNIFWIKVSLLLLLLFGILLFGIILGYGIYKIHLPGYIVRYLDTLGMGGTEDYLIKALLWAKYNTEENAIFSFWWDYGYYVQTIANRTTWLDGGNAFVYWNHLMGRYGLCGNETEALELIYVHSTYDFKTFKVLEFLNKNDVFYKKLYKELGFSNEEINIILNMKERLKEKWINLLYSTNKNFSKLKEEFNLSEEEIKILEKLEKTKYTRPSYYLIHPTDIGKFYQFSKLGGDDLYDKHTWIIPFYSVNTNLVIFADENKLFYNIGNFLLDEDIRINNTKIPRCIPEMGIYDCGRISLIEVVFKEPIIKRENLKEEIIIERIIPENIEDAFVYLSYNGKTYKLRLGCIYFAAYNKKVIIENSTYNGCLYIIPSVNLIYSGIIEGIFSSAYFISQKAMNYLWIKLYFFEEETKSFTKVYDSFEAQGINSMLYLEAQPLKIWKVEFPENFEVPEYKYCLYLATNLEEINKCAEKYNLPKYDSIWNV